MPPRLLKPVWFLVGLLAASTAWAAVEPRVVRLGVLNDNHPFSYLDSDGKIKGFAFDLLDEIESVMGLKFERVTGPTKDINAGFREGRINVLQSYAHFPERDNEADFSVPYLTLAGAIIVRKNETRINDLSDLRGRKVLVHRASQGEAVLRRAGLTDSITYTNSVEDAIRAVDRGDADATLATRLTGLSRAHYFGLHNIRALDVKVEGYEVRYCIAVQEGDRELLAQINEGLAILVRTGRFEALYQKWFGHLEPVGYSATQVMGAVAVGLALALAVAVWAASNQRSLRKRLAQQAEALQRSEERYRGVFEGASDGLLVLEAAPASGEIVVSQINPAARRLLQTGSGPAPGAKLRSVLGADPVLGERLAAAVNAGQAMEFEHEKPAAAGWWRVSVSPLGGRVLVSLRDISEQTQVRLRLQKQDEHMRHTQKIEAIGTLAGGIAHDFNNLLTAILGNTQVTLLNLPRGHPETGSLEQVVKASRRAQQLVKQILTFSRRSEASKQVVRLSAVTEEVIGFLKAVARGTVEFEHRTELTEPEILADSGQIHQVLMNIGTNALQAMRGTPGKLSFVEELVTLDAENQVQQGLKAGRYLRVVVQDTGPGMTREVVERIFEPFFTTKPLGEGTGLGLSVVHGIMQQHDGAVTVTSAPGRGTSFNLYFPVASRTATAPAEEPAGTIASGRGQSLLFVDDDPTIVETVRKLLQRQGYAVSAHLRADEALIEFEAAPDRFALVFSDLTMPGLNGLQLAARVRALRPNLSLVLVSGYWAEADLAEARRLQVSATLHKPLTYELLGRTMAEHLPRNGTH